MEAKLRSLAFKIVAAGAVIILSLATCRPSIKTLPAESPRAASEQ